MKYIAVMLLIALGCAVARRVYRPLLFVFAVAIVALLFTGCATERPSPGPAQTGELCGDHDGTYQLLNCKRYFT